MKAKLLRMTRKRPAETAEAFRRRWIAEHKGKQAVVTFSTGEVAAGGKEAPFDGMSVVYFPNEKAARAAAEGLGEDIVLVCDEHLMSQKPKAEWKLKVVRTSRALPEGLLEVTTAAAAAASRAFPMVRSSSCIQVPLSGHCREGTF